MSEAPPGSRQKLKQFADSVYRFSLQKRSKFDTIMHNEFTS